MSIDWSRSNCYGKGQFDEIFFDWPGKRPPKVPPYAKFCVPCPIKEQCFKYAVANKELGVWGNSTEQERKALPLSIVNTITNEAREKGWILDEPLPKVPLKPLIVVAIKDITLEDFDSIFSSLE